MLIVNADDWGRSRPETDAALACYQRHSITSTSAMVFMEDSERAAELAKGCGIEVGLHLNLSQAFTKCPGSSTLLRDYQAQICAFLRANRYALILYNPFLRAQFRYVYQSQAEEFRRLYARHPSHVNGHQHLHLCSNVLLDRIIPQGQKVRRSFSFRPGEKSLLNRAYRRLVDKLLARRYRLTDFFFDLARYLDGERFGRVLQLSRLASVELMAHPARPAEYAFLTSGAYLAQVASLQTGTCAPTSSAAGSHV